MKTSPSFFVPALLMMVCLFGTVRAQVVTTLHSLMDGTVANDSNNPGSLFKGIDGNFYYITTSGGVNSEGAIWSVTPQGVVSLFYSFDPANGFYNPNSLIQASDGTFYGTTATNVFKVTSAGQASLLHTFESNAILNPLIVGTDGNIYGTDSNGGSKSEGSFYKMTTAGVVTILHNFGNGAVVNDGFYPDSALIQGTDGNFYGTTSSGGRYSQGTLFKMTSAGTETILHSFADPTVTNEGYAPSGGKLLQGTDGNFYGTTIGGSQNIFKVTPQGVETVLHVFGSGNTLNDGSTANNGLIQGTDGNFYGTTQSGGNGGGVGTIFEMTPQGVVTILHSFGDGSVLNEGEYPYEGLIKGSGTLFYGTTSSGGVNNGGTIYTIDISQAVLSSPVAGTGSISLPFQYQVTAGEGVTTYAATNLPAGLSINGTTGLISGTPTATGTKTVTLTLTNANGTTTVPITLTIRALGKPVITGLLTSYGAVGAAFSYPTIATNLPTGYSATGLAGTGLTLNTATGVISGTPTTAGTFTVTLTAANSAGTGDAVSLSIQIDPVAALVLPETPIRRLGDGSLNNDGTGPETLFQGADGNFYYATRSGGAFSYGGIYEVTPQGTPSVIYSFNTSSDLDSPTSVMQGADGNFYGTTNTQAYEVTTGGQLILLHFFGSGASLSPLIQATDGNFYGVDYNDGTHNLGMVFKMTPQGTVTVLHSFGDGTVLNDGTNPSAALVQGTDGNFYGTTSSGGSASRGTFYKITPSGTETLRHSFGDGTVANEGSNPTCQLVQGADGNFYGVTTSNGTIFKITPSGTATVMHLFGDGSTLNDGSSPNGSLIAGRDGNFYGTTSSGGGPFNANDGTVFEMTPQGTVTILHSFNDGSVDTDGYSPADGVIQGKDGNLYGTTSSGGSNGNGGTIYEIGRGAFFLTSPTSVTGTISTAFSYQVFATNPPTAYAATNLPAGLSISATTGLISGTPTAVQTKQVTLTLTTVGGSATFPLTVAITAAPKPVITSVLTSYGSVNTPYSYAITATNSPTSYSATGLSGTGLSLDPATGVISGTPPTAGTYPVTLTATNSAGSGSSVALSLQVLDAPFTYSQETILHRLGDGTVAYDGTNPESLLQATDGNFYYATLSGGVNNYGAVYEVTPQGLASLLYSFSPQACVYSPTSLIQGADGNFYGTTYSQVFELTATGQLSILHSFGSNVGLNNLLQGNDGNFYGVIPNGGTHSEGAVFKVTAQGVTTILHNFGDGSVVNDGTTPNALIQGADGNFYGVTTNGGLAGYGTVFKITPGGSEAILHNFGDGTVTNDGNGPQGALVQGADGDFYGVTTSATYSYRQTIFKITPDGTETVLHTLGDGSTLNDGAVATGSLVQGTDGNFYGTTQYRGGTSSGSGCVFVMTPQGTVTILHSFNDGSVANDGMNPYYGLIQGKDGNFYGTTSAGGAVTGGGTVFSLGISAPALLSDDTIDAPTSLFFTYQISATNHATSFAAAGLPPGLTLNTVTGLISGTPTTAGTYPVTLTLTNSGGSTTTTVTMTIDTLQAPAISSLLTSYGSVGVSYAYAVTATGRPTAYAASGLTGTGLSINTTTGIISGTPTTSGTISASLTATNTAGTSAPVTLSIQIAPAPVLLSQEAILHRLSDGSVSGDGTNPLSLIQAYDGNYYYVTTNGGANGYGAVYSMTPQGTVSIFYSFNYQSEVYGPTSLMQGLDGNFYGTTSYQTFELTTTGQLILLHAFEDSSAMNGLIQARDGNFYGVCQTGGTQNDGYVFKMTPQGAVTVLHSFGDGSVLNDGTTPYASLLQGTDGDFYGDTYSGGSTGNGTVYKITAAGTVTILHNFKDGSVPNDGVNPVGSLLQGTDGNFYGVTVGAGSTFPTIFKMTPSGTETIVHSFGDGSTLNDGSYPVGLIQGSDGNFYGTTQSGGGTTNSYGTVFQMTPLGTVTTLHSFADGSVSDDGTRPGNGLIEGKDGKFYGTTPSGGSSANGGTIFVLSTTLPFLTSPVTANGSVSIPFSYQVTATNTPTSYTATNLPAGLSINGVSGLISGTPTTVQTKPVSLTLTNATGSRVFTLTITVGALQKPAISSILVAYGSVGQAFLYSTAATNLPTSFTATGLTNTGLSLDTTTGIISGTPKVSGTFPITLSATNSAGTGATASLSLKISSSPVTLSQEYNITHRLQDGSVANDGSGLKSVIQAFDGKLYYLTQSGGAYSAGAVYQQTIQGKVTLFYSFNSASDLFSPTSLIQGADGNFYGTTLNQIFRLNALGQVSILHCFGSAVGSLNPLVQGADGSFYGTLSGGNAGSESVFKITPQGAVTILHTFGDGSTVNDGSAPAGALIQAADGNFYGTTQTGGAGYGTVYKATPQGAETILHSFNDGNVASDGTSPEAGLVQGTDGNFYGTTYGGGTANLGTVFEMTPSGQITILHNFGDSTVPSDGTSPNGGLIQGYDGNFYGTTYSGGSANTGTLFEITPQGVETIIHNFGDPTLANDGIYPTTGVIQGAEGNFYGATSQGGDSSNGGIIYDVAAAQSPFHAPIFIGAAYGSGPILTPFSFTPKALFGVSPGTGTSVVTASGFMSSLVSLVTSVLPDAVQKAFTVTDWTLSGTLPSGLNFDSTSGTISGTPVLGGTYTVVMTPHNAINSGTATTVTIYINVPPGIQSGLSATGHVGQAFTYQIEAIPAPDSYGAAQLPDWLTADPVTGIVSGTPPAAGTYIFSVLASNGSGETAVPISLAVTGGASNVPAITSSGTAEGAEGAPFFYATTTTPVATSFSAMDLPSGLQFDETNGVMSGIPALPGTFQVPITATNASGSYSAVVTVNLVGPAQPTIASTLALTVQQGAAFSYQIPATGVPSSYTATGLPTGVSIDPTTGIISGTVTGAGTSSVMVTVSNVIGSATSTLSLFVVAPATFSDWETAHHFNGALADVPEKDGVPNLLKYVYDIDPTTTMTSAARAALPTVGMTTANGNTYLTLIYRQYAALSGVTVNVETSSDLNSWTIKNPPDLARQIGVDATTGDPVMQVGVQTNGTTNHFIRIRVTPP